MIWDQLMDSIRKWLNRPKKDDQSLLAQFFFADENLIVLAGELDSFDGRQEPERCTNLVQRLRQCQDRVLNIVNAIMDVLIKDERADRDFRVKFPEDILEDNLSGQLWFGAECLAAGSSILNRESESSSMRPLAKALVKSLENVRNLLREVCLRSNTPNGPLQLDNNEHITEMLLANLKIFDRLFAGFEFNYVSAMVHIKSTQEYELQELIGVLFSETLSRALKMDLLTQEMIDDCEPSIMFTIPRLAIVYGLLIYPDGPLCVDKPIDEMSEMFKPFRTLLQKIRELLWTLSNHELYLLEKSLCDSQAASDRSASRPVAVIGSDSSSGSGSNNSSNGGERSYRNVLEVDDEKSDDSEEMRLSQQQELEQQQQTIDCFYKEFKMCKDEVEKTTQRPLPVAAATTTTARPDDEQVPADLTTSEMPAIPNTSRPATLRELSQKQSTSAAHSSTKSRGHHHTKSHRKHAATSAAVAAAATASSSSSFPATTASSSLLTPGFIEDRLALLKADIAFRNEIKSKFRSSEDLLHRLFVCVSGVADQLQTNFASDLRSILKSVYLINNSKNSNSSNAPEAAAKKESPFDNLEYLPPASDVIISGDGFEPDSSILAEEALFVDTDTYFQRLDISRSVPSPLPSSHDQETTTTPAAVPLPPSSSSSAAAAVALTSQPPLLPPVWIPDIDAPKCMDCDMTFTVLKRRHHCRKCGKIFCAKCSSNNIPLPQFGHFKAVRVCNMCFFSPATSSADSSTQPSPS